MLEYRAKRVQEMQEEVCVCVRVVCARILVRVRALPQGSVYVCASVHVYLCFILFYYIMYAHQCTYVYYTRSAYARTHTLRTGAFIP